MIKRALLYGAVALCLSCLAFNALGESMTPEEQAVRTTYARLAYAIQLRTLHHAVIHSKGLTTATLNQQLQADNIRVQLNNFWVGDVSELGNRKYSDLVTKPIGQVLAVAVVAFTSTDDGVATRENNAEAKWIPAVETSENWDVNAATLIRQSENGPYWKRAATFTADVTYAGESRVYNAMFLFGTDSKGKQLVLAADNVINNSALTFYAQNPVYPTTLLKGRFATNPVVREWLTTTQVQSESCQSNDTTCCDLSTLKCGPSATDVKKMPALPAKATPQSMTTNPSAIGSGIKPAIVTECSDWSFDTPITPYEFDGTEQHATGNHKFVAGTDGSCDYVDSITNKCDVNATAETHATMAETGVVSVLPYCHETGYNIEDGNAFDSPAHSGAGGAVRNCTACLCSVSVGISGTVLSFSFPSDSVFTRSVTYSNSCPSRAIVAGTPIIIDLTGEGYHLTSAAAGVKFDISGSGQQVQLGWTAANSRNAFLALDRNNDGVITSGKELFGNFTAQPKSDDPNGFLALAVFDDPANGGNGDGVIDAKDQIWNRLVLWIDSNHDGVSQANELYPLESQGVYSLGLKYTESRRQDKYGNIFRYKGIVNPLPAPHDDHVGRIMYDVLLVTDSSK